MQGLTTRALVKRGQKYLRAKRNYFAQDFINDRRRGSNLIPDFDHFRGLFRKDAESIDRDLKSGNNNLIEGAKRKIRLAVFDDHILKRSNNKEMLAKKEARRANKSFIDPLLKNKETRAERAKQLAAERASKASQVQQQTQKAAESTVKQGVEKVAAGLAVGAKKLADKKKEQQKEFAEADYKDLDSRAKKELREYRNKLAKELNFKRNEINKKLADELTAAKNAKFGSEFEISAAKSKAHFGRNRAASEASSKARFKRLDSLGDTNSRRIQSEISINRHEAIADELRAKKALGKSLKKIGYTGLGLAGTAALAYGGKKLYDKYKKDQDSEKN